MPYLLAACGGVAFACAWPPFGWWALAPVAAALLALAALRARGVLHAALAGTLGFLPAWIWLELWIVQVTPIGTAALVVYCSLYAGLIAALVRLVAYGPDRGLPIAVLLPVVWCAVELLRARLVMNGYPWFQLGAAFLGGETSSALLAQGAVLSGVVVPTALAACVGGGLVDLIRRHRAGGAIAVAALLLATIVAWTRLSGGDATPERTLRVLAVQTNLPTSNKIRWTPEAQMRDVPAFLRLSAEGVRAARAEGEPPDLVVWPETMVPGYGLEPATLDMLEAGGYFPGRIFLRALEDLRDLAAAPLLVGSPVYLGLRPDPESERWRWDRHHNSAYLIDIGAAPPFPRYDKLFLTPFGERMPVISNWEWLEQRLLAFGAPGMSFDLDAGERPVRFAIRAADGSTVRFATPICFEDTVAEVCRALAYERGRPAVDLLVNISNDGWFGWSDAGRRHHVLHARLRAIELGIPVLRCANTGMSVLIDRFGRVTAWLGHDAPGDGRIEGVLRATVPIAVAPTPFGRFGDWASWLAGLAAATLAWRAIRDRRSASERTPPA
jgi:apolipoprotein N-acyltransferase